MHLLFICSRNQWRSPTAEAIFKQQGYNARSAGTEPSARIRVTEKLLAWADVIFVMEKRHRQRLAEKFGNAIANKQLIVLDIPDDYQYMDEELVALLEASVLHYLEQE